MVYKQIEKGKIEFKGIDNWNGQLVTGLIIYQPIDVKINQVWEVKFYDINGSIKDSITEFRAASAKKCKEWLSN